jgi:ABC-type branched-subunit amino acid transport system substrate-binding protein
VTGVVLAALSPPVAAAQTAKIAAQLSTTGAGETFGAPALDGARLAVEEANASGDLPRIELLIRDDASNVERGRELAREIIASECLVVVGPATTPMALATGPVYAEAGLVAIGTTATGDAVTDSSTFFRASFSTGDAGEALATYLHYVLGGSKAWVLFSDDGYGKPVAAGFKRVADRVGIAAVYRPLASAADREEAARAAAADPDHPAVVLGMIADIAPVVEVLRRQGAQGPIIGTNAIAGDYFGAFFANEPEKRQNPGFFTDGIYAASPLLFDSANAETLAFVERFRARFGHDPSYISVQGYEATRLAVAAVRATAGRTENAGDPKARRQAIRAYLSSLDGPARAVAGLNGPLWFTPERGRVQALRIGRFTGTQFQSAPSQLVPAAHPDAAEIAAGAVIETAPGRFLRRQQVVYTGMFLNEIARVDIAQSTFTADFYLWMRFARGSGGGLADPADITFPNLVGGRFNPAEPVAKGELPDGTTYRLWHVRGDFKNDFDLHHYPSDRQTLVIGFFNALADSDRIVYVSDRRSLDAAAQSSLGFQRLATAASPVGAAQASASAPLDLFDNTVAADAFRNLTQWTAQRAIERRDDLVTNSALGDPRLVGLERLRELSGFNLSIDLRRRVVATLTKTLLPLGLMALIMFASLSFPAALVKEKVTVAITGALSGAVLLSAINSQLGNVGYVIAVEYVFYIFFTLCLLCIVAVLAAERMRATGRGTVAQTIEQSARYLFLLGLLGTSGVAWLAYLRW